MPDVKQDAIEVLQSYEQQFTTILEVIGESPRLTGEAKEKAQQLLQKLKDNLESDCKEYHRQRDRLDQYKKAFVEPALREAMAELRVKVNSVPGSEWHSNLYSARVNVTHMLHELEEAS